VWVFWCEFHGVLSKATKLEHGAWGSEQGVNTGAHSRCAADERAELAPAPFKERLFFVTSCAFSWQLPWLSLSFVLAFDRAFGAGSGTFLFVTASVVADTANGTLKLPMARRAWG
jgi:hypothetical protein